MTSHSILQAFLGERAYHYAQLADEDTEAQRGFLLLRGTQFCMVELASEPGQSALNHRLPAESWYCHSLCKGLVGEAGATSGQTPGIAASPHPCLPAPGPLSKAMVPPGSVSFMGSHPL